MGFGERHRALEVLPQLQQLHFDWSAGLQNAVAVEVEKDGRLRMLQSQLLDPAASSGEVPKWKAILSAIVPMPYLPRTTATELISEVRSNNAEGSSWLGNPLLDKDFVRNAAALLRPGNSAILTAVDDWPSAAQVLSGFSRIVLHTKVSQFEVPLADRAAKAGQKVGD
jgi:uncharacterized membrane protein